MNLLETFQMAIKNILSSKVRTLLTMLGIIIGVCAVIVIVGLGNGMQGYIEESFADMGTDSLTVQILGRGSSRSVSEDQMYALVSENQDLYKQISPTVTMMGAVKIGSDSISTSTVTGVSEDYFDMKGYTIAQGRNLDYVDIAGRKKVCIVGQYLNMAYFGGNAVGQTIRVNGTAFTVVGVMGAEGHGAGRRRHRRLRIPAVLHGGPSQLHRHHQQLHHHRTGYGQYFRSQNRSGKQAVRHLLR